MFNADGEEPSAFFALCSYPCTLPAGTGTGGFSDVVPYGTVMLPSAVMYCTYGAK